MLRILFITLITFCFAQTASAQGRNILVFGDSNSWGWAPVLAGAPTTRYPAQSRWPNVMAKTLGTKANVTIDALSGRTVDQDLPSAVGVLPSGDFNGRRAFPASLARELPLDMVIIMLGTNDLRSDIGRTPSQIAQSLRAMADDVTRLSGGVMTSYPSPKVMIVIPPPLGDVSRTPISAVMSGRAQASRELSSAVRMAFAGSPASIIDAGNFVTTDGIDGVHFSAQAHRILGRQIAREVRAVFDQDKTN